MILLLRVILIGLIIYLLLRSFVRYYQSDEAIPDNSSNQNKTIKGKKVSKEVGEYIDYEEVDEGK